MSDRELLEKAAKAAGYSGVFNFNNEYGVMEPRGGGVSTLRPWNPLRDDGDALRLAVKLGLAVVPYPIYAKPKHSVIAKQYDHARYLRGEGQDVLIEEVEVYGDDPAAATRRAIVRAAAALAGESQG